MKTNQYYIDEFKRNKYLIVTMDGSLLVYITGSK